jgi:hypothetical protein
LHASYPNGTPKAIIRAERDKVIRDVPAKLAQLETARAAYVAGYADLSRITASDVRFTMERIFRLAADCRRDHPQRQLARPEQRQVCRPPVRRRQARTGGGIRAVQQLQ